MEDGIGASGMDETGRYPGCALVRMDVQVDCLPNLFSATERARWIRETTGSTNEQGSEMQGAERSMKCRGEVGVRWADET